MVLLRLFVFTIVTRLPLPVVRDFSPTWLSGYSFCYNYENVSAETSIPIRYTCLRFRQHGNDRKLSFDGPILNNLELSSNLWHSTRSVGAWLSFLKDYACWLTDVNKHGVDTTYASHTCFSGDVDVTDAIYFFRPLSVRNSGLMLNFNNGSFYYIILEWI